MKNQKGVVLLIMLALLFIATVLAIAMVNSTISEIRISALRTQREVSYSLAELAANQVINKLNNNDTDLPLTPFKLNCSQNKWIGGLDTSEFDCLTELIPILDYSGYIKIHAGMAGNVNQLRARSAVIPIPSGFGPIIGTPGRYQYVLVTNSIFPNTNKENINWIDRKNGAIWIKQQNQSNILEKAPFNLVNIPTPLSLNNNPWESFKWSDYNRYLKNDAISALKERAGLVEGTELKDSVSQRYQRLKDAYQNWEDLGNQYNGLKTAVLIEAILLDAGQSIILSPQMIASVAGIVSGLATLGTTTLITAAATTALSNVENSITTAAFQNIYNEFESIGNDYVNASIRVIEARNDIRRPWISLDNLHDAEKSESTWKCGKNDTDRVFLTEKTMKDQQFYDQTFSNLAIKNVQLLLNLINPILMLSKTVGYGQHLTNVLSLIDELKKNEKQILDIIKSGIDNKSTKNEIEPIFMLVDINPLDIESISTGDGYIQSHVMCNDNSVLTLTSQAKRFRPFQTNTPSRIQYATIIHSGVIKLASESRLINNKVNVVIISNDDITIAQDKLLQKLQTGQNEGFILWTDKDIQLNRPIHGAIIAGGTLSIDNTLTEMLKYNPALDITLLGKGKYPIAGYTLGSWSGLDSN